MLAVSREEFISFFKEIEDPREDEKLLYPLHEVLFLVFVSVLCCAESWQEIINFGTEKLHILRKYFAYENGLPTKSSLSRIFSLIDKKHMENWLETIAMSSIKDLLKDEHLAIDGKSLRGKQKMEGSSQGAHVVNLYATKLGLVLSQKTVPNKGNELAGIKEIIDNSNLKDTVVSIDAIGCRKEIAQKIYEKKGNYFLSLKDNEPKTKAGISALFLSANNIESYKTENTGHGRTEVRTCHYLELNEELIAQYSQWHGLKSVCKIESLRRCGDKETTKIKYYLSSQRANAEKHLSLARNHWAIENNLHWVLDVMFNEDSSLIRKNNAAENISAVRKMVINTLKKFKTQTGSKAGINHLRKSAGWNDENLTNILNSWITT